MKLKYILLLITFLLHTSLFSQELEEVADSVSIMSAGPQLNVGDVIDIRPQEELDTLQNELCLPEYPAWNVASISGKLKMEGLPISPTVKIFMERDSSIFISIKAPFMGEVGRIELTPDSLLAVNKMKKTYVLETMEDFLKYFPGNFSDVQELILGRIVIPGFGTLGPENEEVVEILENEEELFLVPTSQAAIEGFDYGYIIDENFTPKALLVIPRNNPEIGVNLIYSYFRNNYDFTLRYQYGSRRFEATLEFDYPQWEGEAMKPVKIDKKFMRVSLSDFVRSF